MGGGDSLSFGDVPPSRSEIHDLEFRGHFSEPMREHENCDQVIVLAFAEQPFALIGQLVRLTHLPRTTVHRRLTQPLGFEVRHLQWVPHRLSDTQKSNRVELSLALLSVLRTQQGRRRHDITLLDESCFDLNTDHESIWLHLMKNSRERTTHSSVGKTDVKNCMEPQ
jgi:hypothetical protein